MKKVLLIIFLLLSYIGFSQDFCDYRVTNDNTTSTNNRNTLSRYACSQSADYIRNKLTTLGNDFSNEAPVVINVKFHVVSTLQDDVTECMILQNVAQMNHLFNQFKIYFKYTGYVIYSGITPTDETKLHIMIAEFGNAFMADSFGKLINLSYPAFLAACSGRPGILLHEVGHALSLRHTHVGSTADEGVTNVIVHISNPFDCHGTLMTDVLRPDFSNYSPGRRHYTTEHVTRNPLDPNYNAYTAGDCVPDTSAMTINIPTCYDPSTNEREQIRFDEVVDIVGEPYDYNYLSTNNIMGPIHHKYLTTGQGWRMRSYIETCIQYNHLIGTAVNPDGVSSLLKPYYSNIDVDMDNNHIVSIRDDRDHPGYEIVCRPQYLAHKFQTGFEYQIYKVNNGYYFNGDVVNPSDATLQEIIPADADCNTVIGAKLAVKIPSLSDDIIMFEDLPGVRGYYCSSEQVTNTTIYSTRDLGSGNGTIKELDTQESADPYLENNLEEQKYHNIKKTTNTGAQKNKTLYKE